MQRYVSVHNKTRGTCLARTVAVAETLWSRTKGLLGRKSLPPDSGMWLLNTTAIHTIGMMFAFDLILIDSDARVVELREQVRPYSIVWSNRKAKSALELPAGTIAQSQTQIGDQLTLDPCK